MKSIRAIFATVVVIAAGLALPAAAGVVYHVQDSGTVVDLHKNTNVGNDSYEGATTNGLAFGGSNSETIGGGALAKSAVDLEGLHVEALTRVVIDKTAPELTAATGVASAFASVKWDDVVVSGPPGVVLTHFSSVMHGLMSATQSGAGGLHGQGGLEVSVGAGRSLADFGQIGYGAVYFYDGKSHPENMLRDFLTHDSRFTSPDFSVDANVPFLVSLNVTATALVNVPRGYGAVAQSDCSHTLSFVTDGPVFDLPPGYTINSAEAGIVNNHFVGGGATSAPNLLLGDFNRDAQFDAADIPAMLAALSDINGYKAAHSLSDADLLSIGDVDLSRTVNNVDLQSLLTLLKSGGVSFTAVPEPATLQLLLAALLAIGYVAHASRHRTTRIACP